MGKGCGVVTSDNFSAFLAMNPRLRFDYESNFDRCRSDSTIMFPVTSSGRQDRVPSEVDFFAEISGKPVVKEETTVQDSSRRDGGGVNTGLQLVSANTRGDVISDDRSRDELVQLRMEVEKLKEENQKLKVVLNQVTNDYSALRMSFETLMRQRRKNQDDSKLEIIGTKSDEKRIETGEPAVLRRRLFDLVSDDQSNSSSDERTLSKSPNLDIDSSGKKRSVRDESPGSEGWNLDKTPKLNPPSTGAMASESSVEATMRKVRVSVRARSEAPMISDGCQWRKYGQKMAKGNPCPRAYYRCTMAVGCPVRKQVQRCAEDRTILITTYEGTHNHPLPPAAMAMASTTSAAASMLLSGAMPSNDGLMNSNILARTILPCSSNMATISASAPFPTITLDLTHSALPRPPPQHFPVPIAPGSNVFAPAMYNQSTFSGLQVSQGMVHQQGQPSLVEALSATTAAITADPNFMAALVAAVSSIIGGGGGVTTNNNSNSSNTVNIDTNASNNNKCDSNLTGS